MTTKVFIQKPLIRLSDSDNQVNIALNAGFNGMNQGNPQGGSIPPSEANRGVSDTQKQPNATATPNKLPVETQRMVDQDLLKLKGLNEDVEKKQDYLSPEGQHYFPVSFTPRINNLVCFNKAIVPNDFVLQKEPYWFSNIKKSVYNSPEFQETLRNLITERNDLQKRVEGYYDQLKSFLRESTNQQGPLTAKRSSSSSSLANNVAQEKTFGDNESLVETTKGTATSLPNKGSYLDKIKQGSIGNRTKDQSTKGQTKGQEVINQTVLLELLLSQFKENMIQNKKKHPSRRTPENDTKKWDKSHRLSSSSSSASKSNKYFSNEIETPYHGGQGEEESDASDKNNREEHDFTTELRPRSALFNLPPREPSSTPKRDSSLKRHSSSSSSSQSQSSSSQSQSSQSYSSPSPQPSTLNKKKRNSISPPEPNKKPKKTHLRHQEKKFDRKKESDEDEDLVHLHDLIESENENETETQVRSAGMNRKEVENKKEERSRSNSPNVKHSSKSTKQKFSSRKEESESEEENEEEENENENEDEENENENEDEESKEEDGDNVFVTF